MRNFPEARIFCLITLITASGCGQPSDPPPTPQPATAPGAAPEKAALSAPVLEPKESAPQPPKLPKEPRSLGAPLRAPAIATGDPELDPLVSYLKASFAAVITDNGRLVIEDKTELESLFFGEPDQDLSQRLLRQSSDQVPAGMNRDFTDMIRNFCEKNRKPRPVWPELTRHLPASMVTLVERNAFFTGVGDVNAGWQRFYAKNPGAHGIITVSRVGLSRDKTLALLYVGEQQGMLAGHGQLHVLKKEGNAWVELPVKIGPSWVS